MKDSVPKGCYWDKAANKWRAAITHQGKKIYLGRFDCQLDAHEAYLRAKRKVGAMIPQNKEGLNMRDLLNHLFEYKDGELIRKVSTGNVKAGDSAGSLKANGRVRAKIDGKFYSRSRLIWIMHHGDIPEGMLIDHIDNEGLKSDDRIENLRLATHSQNLHNIEARGHHWDKAANKWKAQIAHQGQKIHLGLFDCQIDARAEYLRAKRKYAGEFAPK